MTRPARAAIFVTGTDTGVGKTAIAAALVRRLRALGRNAIGMKPVETGCTYGEDQDLIASDGVILHLAAHRAAPPLAVSPYRFLPRVAPAIAAEQTGLELELADLVQAVEAIFSFGDLAIVEGSGGALTPLTRDGLGLDLAERLGAVVLIVAPDVHEVQSQTLLILEAARRRALRIAGVVLTRIHAPRDADALQNARMIRESGGVTVFPTVPHYDEKDLLLAIEGHFAAHGIAEAILEALDRP